MPVDTSFLHTATASPLFHDTTDSVFATFPSQPQSDLRRRSWKESLHAFAYELGNVVLETLWPTRCAICDTFGELLCERCASQLPFIDSWRACPRCGAPYGIVQCCECNSHTLDSLGLDSFPLDQAASALICTSSVKRLVTTYKDGGERRLVRTMAQLAKPYLSPGWLKHDPVLTFIPASKKALIKRGFDHNHEFANALSEVTGLAVAPLFSIPKTHDQRALGRKGRFSNMQAALHLIPNTPTPPSVIILDDVCTTGATLLSAANTLRHEGAKHVWGLTLARV